MFVEVAGGLRLGDVEVAEQHEGGELPEEGGRRQQQDQPEGDDFVPDDAAVVGVADGAAGDVDEPDSSRIGYGEQENKAKIGKIRVEQREGEPREQRAEGARRLGGQAAAAAEREEMRRVGEQESEARLGCQSGRIPCGRIRPACRPGRKR